MTTLVVAMTAYGCGDTEREAEPIGKGLAHVRSVGGQPAGGAPDAPAQVDLPMTGHLDPDLLDAVRAAADDARKDGVELTITSGWRSRAEQQRLLDDAIRKYGSEEEALRYVATPDSSAHVTGDAVDIGPTDADDWLIRHGDAYGLCQIFGNEMWHFELATTPGGTCPDLLPDGSYR